MLKSGNKPKKAEEEVRTADKDNNNDVLAEFMGSKADPKYQTLPSNTRFHSNYNSNSKPVNGTSQPPLAEPNNRIPSHLNPRYVLFVYYL